MIDATEVACALCGARDTRRLYTKFGYGIERCRRCGLVYANPRAPADRILGRYSREYFWNEYLPAIGAPEGRVENTFIDDRYRPMLSLIGDRAPGARRLLEIGSGAGLFLKAAERAGWSVAGIEMSEHAAVFARGTLGLDVSQASAERLPFADASFEIAVMFDVVEHLFDPRAALASIRRVLRPGGLLVVTTPNFNALSRFVLGVDWAVLSPLEHLYYYTRRTFRRILIASGFSRATFPRAFEGWARCETMNYRYTNAPDGPKARRYAGLVEGPLRTPARYRLVQRAGLGDVILCLAIA